MVSRVLPTVSVECFLGRYIHVKCCSGYEVEGLLTNCDASQHGGIGTLILNCGPSCWVMIRCWKMIYTLEGE